MTTEEFKRNADLRAKLEEAITSHAFRTAVSLIREATDAVAGPHDVNPVKKAALYDQRAGVTAFLKHLQLLTLPYTERKPLKARSLAKSDEEINAE